MWTGSSHNGDPSSVHVDVADVPGYAGSDDIGGTTNATVTSFTNPQGTPIDIDKSSVAEVYLHIDHSIFICKNVSDLQNFIKTSKKKGILGKE